MLKQEPLREIFRESPNTPVPPTRRPGIDDETVRRFSEAVLVPISPTRADIRSYLEMKSGGDTNPKAMDHDLWADIMRILLEKITEV